MSRCTNLVVLLLLVAHFQCSRSRSNNFLKCQKDQLKVTIESVDANEVLYRIDNIGKKEVCALKWNTMMDNEYWASAVTVFGTENEAMPYSEPVVPLRQSKPTSNDYVIIKKGGHEYFNRPLSTLFSFEGNKKYSLHIQTYIEDCYTLATTATACEPREAKKQTGMECKNEIAEFSFIAEATKNDPQTLAQWLKNQSPSKRLEVKGRTILAVFGSITDDQFAELSKTHELAKLYLKESVDYLKDKEKAKALYKVWFGTYSEKNYKKVQNFFDETLSNMNQPYIYNMLPEELCLDAVLAYVDSRLLGKNQHVINVCPMLFTNPENHFFWQKTITFVHEMTHDSAGTCDEKYKGQVANGEEQAKALAKKFPKKAIENAENYAYFAEKVYNEVNPSKIYSLITSKEFWMFPACASIALILSNFYVYYRP